MQFRTKKIIQELENKIEKSYSLPIFRGYVAVNKRGLEKLLDEMYATLPVDIQVARQYLKNSSIELKKNQQNSNKASLYDYLKKFEIIIEETLSIASYVILNIREIEELLDKMYETIPDEIVEVETLSNK